MDDLLCLLYKILLNNRNSILHMALGKYSLNTLIILHTGCNYIYVGKTHYKALVTLITVDCEGNSRNKHIYAGVI